MKTKYTLLALCIASVLNATNASAIEIINIPVATPEQPQTPSVRPNVYSELSEKVKPSLTGPVEGESIEDRLARLSQDERALQSESPATSVTGNSATQISSDITAFEERSLVRPAPRQPIARTARPIQHIGTQHSSPSLTQSVGRDLPLSVALPMIAPNGWSTHIDPSAVNIAYAVSWSAGDNWITTLNKFVNSHPNDVVARVNWNANSVLITGNNPSEANTWLVTEGRTLRSVVEEWASRDGWTLVWEHDQDYLLGASSSYNGGFIQAVDLLVMSTSGASRDLNISVYNHNKVVLVESRKGASL